MRREAADRRRQDLGPAHRNRAFSLAEKPTWRDCSNLIAGTTARSAEGSKPTTHPHERMPIAVAPGHGPPRVPRPWSVVMMLLTCRERDAVFAPLSRGIRR